MTFFETLVKPSWMPPEWLFPVAWFSLWTLQAIALFMLVSSDRTGKGTAIGFLVVQFVVAIAWEALIFRPGQLAFAAWWLVLVLILVIIATITAGRVSLLAGALIAPTIIWVSVATTLGFTLLKLNPNA